VLSLSPIKLLLVGAVIMLLMGPDKLPEMAHRIGSSWRALKRLQERMESEVREAIPDLPSTGDIARIARSPISLLNQLADRADAKDAKESADVPETPIPPEPDGSTLFTPPRRSPTPPVHADAPVPPPDPSLN
jgi:TatA/E family protein of Tat protein translocase